MRWLPLAVCFTFFAAPGLAQDDDEWGDEDDAAVVGAPALGEADAAPAEESDEPANEGERGDADEWGEDGGGPVLGDDPVDTGEPAPAPVPPPPPAAPAPAAPPPTAEPAAAPAPPAAEPDEEAAASDEPIIEDETTRRVGDPFPLTRREPLLPQLGLEVGARYGLVGTGPTRFVDDIRFGVFDWLELRTSLLPHPASLMARLKLGSQQGPWGAIVLDGGLAFFDAGLRLVPEEGEAEAGFRAHWEVIAAYTRTLGDRASLFGSVHYRFRQSMLSDDDSHAIAGDLSLSYDILPWLAATGGVGWAAAAFGSPVRELAVNFVETDRPGMSHFLIRNDGITSSFTVPVALTYGRVENFDVDLFATTRLWPQLDIVFGAGVRWRLWFGDEPA